jgi:A/G-specific adenine glycosylase
MSADSLDLLGTWVRVRSLRTRLLAWYDREKRALPWRRDRDPYRVLVSEFMLQQTRVDVVAPYFERWLARWPTLGDLAAASVDDVLAAWSGLGYYRRARSLHALARRVVEEHGGAIPSRATDLLDLPGVGPYTAAAIASIAFDEPVAVVDGNVERVLSRLLCDQRPAGAARRASIEEAARRLVTGMDDDVGAQPLEARRAGDWNQAMMELGAVVCLPGDPQCILCPWAKTCVGNRAGLAADLPKRREKKAPVDVVLRAALVRCGDAFLLVRRPEGSLLSGLWELPTSDDGEDVAALASRVTDVVGADVRLAPEATGVFRHTITNRRITVHVHEATVDAQGVRASGDGVVWIAAQELRDYGVSSMTKKALGSSSAAQRRTRGAR